MKYKNILVVIIVAIVLNSFLLGCSSSREVPEENNQTEKPPSNKKGVELYSHPEYEDLPHEIKNWVENSKQIFVGQTLQHNGKLYVLVTYGRRATGGYDVKITDVTEKEDSFEVAVMFTAPKPGKNVTEAITFPYDLIEMRPTNKEIYFTAQGNEKYVPELQGIDKMEPIAVGKDVIMVFEPAPDTAVGREILFRGIANTFEGTVNYMLKTPQNKKIMEGYTTGSMGDWGYFEEKIKIPSKAPSDFILEVFVYSAKDGEKQNVIQIPITWVEYDK